MSIKSKEKHATYGGIIRYDCGCGFHSVTNEMTDMCQYHADQALIESMKLRIAELEKELRRCVTVMDTDATLPDGSNPSTMVAHVLLGDFCESHA